MPFSRRCVRCRGYIAQANSLAALDNAVAELLPLDTKTGAECEANRVAVDKHDAVIRSLGECLEDGQHLSDTLEDTLTETVSRHTTEAIRKISELARGDDDELAAAMASWNNTDLHADVDELMANAVDEIGECAVTHESAIYLELAAMNLGRLLGTLLADDEEAPRETVAGVTGVGGFVRTYEHAVHSDPTRSVDELGFGSALQKAGFPPVQ